MSNSDFHNRKTHRFQNWNYGWQALNFVTVNTKFGENYFGEIADNTMIFSEIGKALENQWLQTPIIRKDMKIKLDEFVVMPNHFHGIIGIGRNEFNSSAKNISNINFSTDAMHGVRTEIDENCGVSLEINAIHGAHNQKNKFGPQKKNLSSIMRGFKSSVTTYARQNHILFDWHERFHDIIIRDELTLFKIRNYSRNNPKNWRKDRYWK